MAENRTLTTHMVLWIAIACPFSGLVEPTARAADSISDTPDFNVDIRPILSKYCLDCHGRDDGDRQAGVRLDRFEAAIKAADSGLVPIIPGDPDASELIRRVESQDPLEVMPPADSNKVLTDGQKASLRQWVAAGAPYQDHWAFAPPHRHKPPVVKRSDWPRNPIDNFILSQLEVVELSPAPEAERATLFRRLSLDLTGLPPSPDDFAAFDREMSLAKLADNEHAKPHDDASHDRSIAADRVYAKWVDKLLASPHYGERMAVDWLDAARFADTNGYQVDRDREMYAWRDWVIGAFNSNMPFDQFTIEQLAGDLLPNATLDQRIATGFHRNHMLNEEGGVIPEEFLAEYCADRVETTATVWLGQTFLCARCHDHKYDPFTQRDYYSLYAFFHNVSESGLGNYGANIRRNAPPILQLPAPELEAKKASLEHELTDVQKQLEQTEAGIAAGQPDWEKRVHESPVRWETGEPTLAHIGDSPIALDQERSSVHVAPMEAKKIQCVVEARWPLTRMTALRLDFHPVAESLQDAESAQTSELQLDQLQVFAVTEGSHESQPVPLRAAEIEGSLPTEETAKALGTSTKRGAALSFNDNATASLVFELKTPAAAVDWTFLRFEMSMSAQDNADPYDLKILATDVATDLLLPGEIAQIVSSNPEDRTAEQQQQLVEFRQAKDRDHQKLSARSEALTKEIDQTDLRDSDHLGDGRDVHTSHHACSCPWCVQQQRRRGDG